jgi:hypothetical protein
MFRWTPSAGMNTSGSNLEHHPESKNANSEMFNALDGLIYRQTTGYLQDWSAETNRPTVLIALNKKYQRGKFPKWRTLGATQSQNGRQI